MHWKRWRKHGDPTDPGGQARPSAESRFWAKVDKSGNCWLWTGAHYGSGYGAFRNAEGRTEHAHRFSFALVHGPIPDTNAAGELVNIDHLCRVRGCVRPDHLELVTVAENIRRAGLNGFAKANAAKTHCPQGHAYAGTNIKWTKDGRRGCRACHRATC